MLLLSVKNLSYQSDENTIRGNGNPFTKSSKVLSHLLSQLRHIDHLL